MHGGALIGASAPLIGGLTLGTLGVGPRGLSAPPGVGWPIDGTRWEWDPVGHLRPGSLTPISVKAGAGHFSLGSRWEWDPKGRLHPTIRPLQGTGRGHRIAEGVNKGGDLQG